jgi:hypothetical protein
LTTFAPTAIRASELARFVRHVRIEADTGCWLWIGSKQASGYARFHYAGGYEYAHRAAYRFYVGEIPDGLTVDHLCRVRHCVNPDHLEVVPRGVNALRGDGPAAQNTRKTHCPQGHPYTHVNVRGERQCRTCSREASRRYEARRVRAA